MQNETFSEYAIAAMLDVHYSNGVRVRSYALTFTCHTTLVCVV